MANKRIVDGTCLKCNNDKLFTQRSKDNPQYKLKCTKCGWKE
ncbi:unnamed protein product [marine sediment metagenome]|uniref:Uncharacterized protein n=1 Tax=marine sediment metagenome TaxID=412755 RepID=X1C0C3_9ZZZZ